MVNLTAKSRLTPDESLFKALLESIHTFNSCSEYISKFAIRQNKATTPFLKQHLLTDCQSMFCLPAPIVMSAINKVAFRHQYSHLQKRQHVHIRKMSAFRLPAPFISYSNEFANELFIWGVGDLMHNVPHQTHPEHIQLLDHATGGGVLVYKYGSLFAHLNCRLPNPTTNKINGWLGIDLGMVKIASDSLRQHYDDGTIYATRKKRHRQLAQLRKLNTKSSKRKARKLIRAMDRFTQDIDHRISREIVNKASRHNLGIAMERLAGIATSTGKSGGWSYENLLRKITYKATLAGVPVRLVNPAFTSITCSECGSRNTARKDQHSFRCIACGYHDNADFNASKNIVQLATLGDGNAPYAD